jgi:DNA-binding response OmpR family regulator
LRPRNDTLETTCHRRVMVKSPCVRILVVDDSPIWRTFLMGHLQNAGLKALYVAYDGVQAIAKAESLQPDVILMDISLPRLNGIQAAAVIRNVAPRAKIVFVSGNTDPEVRRAALDAGGCDYVVKSLAGRELIGAIRLAIGAFPNRRRASQADAESA